MCRQCGTEIPRGRRSFCSDACVHEWRLRTDPGYLREQVFARDKGYCAVCRLDTVRAYQWLKRLAAPVRRKMLIEWGLKSLTRNSLWDADHILPVAEGGGECDLSNLRTLCLKCHKRVTAELRKRLAASRLGRDGADVGRSETVDEVRVEVPGQEVGIGQDPLV